MRQKGLTVKYEFCEKNIRKTEIEVQGMLIKYDPKVNFGVDTASSFRV